MDKRGKLNTEKYTSGIIPFLESKFFPGIGKVLANRIYESLGNSLLKMESLTPKDLEAVKGLNEKAAASIISAIKNLPVDFNVLLLLFSSGLTYQEVMKIINKYGPHVEQVVMENPYDMVEDVWKFSFFRADGIGRSLGITNDDPRRLRGALLTAVKMFAEQGSLFALRDELLELSSKITQVEKEKLEPELNFLISEGLLINSLGGIYLPIYYNAEVETAERIASIINERKGNSDVEFELPEKDLEGHVFTSEQLNAIRLVRDNPVSIITGDPGTGKTTTVRGLIRLFEDEGKKVLLTAPTGRSVKKLEMMAGKSAKTIHRLLGFNRAKGYFNKKIDADVLIIDEASLLEQVLFNHLLRAVSPRIKIVFVGDLGQLPPIGAGKVFEDIIVSGVVPVARLTHNFRQKEGSALAANIDKIKRGEMPSADEDFYIIEEKNDCSAKEKLLEMVTQTLPEKFGISPSDIQVVTPQLDGVLGSRELNTELQKKINVDSPVISKGMKSFRLGDRVVQSENSARRGIYNGETGKVTFVDPDNNFITVTFSDDKISSYKKDELGELSLAYATSVHKLQGTETDFAVMPLTLEHRKLLYRNVLLTAVSRARKACALIGDPEALDIAVKSLSPKKRNSNLKLRIQKDIGKNK